MITKTYQALRYQTYDMYVEINGKKLLIPFRGGTLRPDIKGTFQTNDPELQAVLAKDTSNGLTFKEIHAFDDEAGPEEDNQNGEGTINVSGITTVQGARDYILANVEGMTQGSLPNKTAVLAIAAQNKIVFTDLK